MTVLLNEPRLPASERDASKVRTFRNPVIRGFHPDPSICRVGTDYYLAVSSFEYFPGVPLFHSRDLIHWRPIGHALTRTSQLDLRNRPASQGIFAPTLRHFRDTFYLVTTDVGGSGNFLLTAKDAAGPWSEPILIDRGCFDPSLFFDDDGRVYYTRRELGRIVQSEIDVSSGRLRTRLSRVAHPFASSDAEGPHLYRVGDWYYLLCAEGGTGYGHMITVGRSRSPNGPFEGCPHNPILTHRHLVPHAIRYTGHGDLVEVHDGSWWIVFLGTRHDPRYGYNFHVMGRETFLAPLEWIDGWPVINGGAPIELEMAAPALKPTPWPKTDAAGVFKDGRLLPEWSTLRTPLPEANCAPLPNGGVRLRGNALTLRDCATPVFLARRQEDFCFSMRVALHFRPTQIGEEAGLALRQSEDFHVCLLLRREEDGVRLIVRRRILDMELVMASFVSEGEVCYMEISGDLTHYSFRAGPASDKLTLLDKCPIRLLSTELATGWTGVMLGFYASGDGRDGAALADFSEIHFQSAHS
jgi:xylan 1,4-beta-xylosidase